MGFAYLLMMSVLTTWGLFVLTFRFCSRYKIVLSEWNPSEWNVNAFIMRVCLLLRSTCDILLQCIVVYCYCLSTFTQHFLMRKKFKNNMKQPDSLCVNGGGVMFLSILSAWKTAVFMIESYIWTLPSGIESMSLSSK